MEVIYANEENFKEVVKEGTFLVDFFAPWCGPCKMIGPVLEEAQKETDVQIVKVDVDQNQELAMIYGVMGVPTLAIFKDGEPVTQRSGFMPKELILKFIEENK